MTMRYIARTAYSGAGGKTRRWIEICEVGQKGGVRRIVARTPILEMRDPITHQHELTRARVEAQMMAGALNDAALARDAAVEHLRQVQLGPERGR